MKNMVFFKLPIAPIIFDSCLHSYNMLSEDNGLVRGGVLFAIPAPERLCILSF